MGRVFVAVLHIHESSGCSLESTTFYSSPRFSLNFVNLDLWALSEHWAVLIINGWKCAHKWADAVRELDTSHSRYWVFRNVCIDLEIFWPNSLFLARVQQIISRHLLEIQNLEGKWNFKFSWNFLLKNYFKKRFFESNSFCIIRVLRVKNENFHWLEKYQKWIQKIVNEETLFDSMKSKANERRNKTFNSVSEHWLQGARNIHRTYRRVTLE